MSWDDDTPDGRYEGSSEALWLDWLKVPGNYAYWHSPELKVRKPQTILAVLLLSLCVLLEHS